MFESIEKMQDFADMLKAQVLDDVDSRRDTRLRALAVIGRMERCGWHPAAMLEAFTRADEMWGVDFSYADGQLVIEPPSASISVVVGYVCEEFMVLTGCHGSVEDEVFDTQAAADYLGLAYNTLKQYVSRDGKLLPTGQVGRFNWFSRADLDRFKEKYLDE